MAVAYVAHTVDTATANVNNPTFEHTVPAGTDRLLIVWAAVKRLETISGIDYDGNALTLLSTKAKGPAYIHEPRLEIWYRVLGTGSEIVADVALTSGSGPWNPYFGVAVSITGADQSDPFGGTGDANAETGSPTADVTTDTANSMLFGAVASPHSDATPYSPDNGETERWDTNTGLGDSEDFALWGADRAVTTAQQYTFGCTAQLTLRHILIVWEVHEAAGGTETSSSRAARTKGKVSDANSSRAARTKGKVTDASSSRAARTKGQVTTSTSRAARTKGESAGVQDSSSRAARTKGKVTDASTSRAARTKGQPDRSEYYGTVTYFMRGTDTGGGAGDDADHACIPGAYGYKLTKNDAAQALVTDTVPGTTNDRICFSWTTDNPEPPTPWPTGDYLAQVDVTYVNPDITFRIQLLRIKVSDCTVLETLGTSGNLTGVGIYEFKLTDYDPSGDTGRFQVRLIADNSDASAQNISCNVRGTNTYVQGPWGYVVSDGRAARTKGKVTDASSSRAARTKGKVSDTSTSRAARTKGKVTDASTSRAARTKGQVTTSSSRAARTKGKATTSSSRAARTKGEVAGQVSSSRAARTKGKVTDASTSRAARTKGQVTLSTSRAARTRGGPPVTVSSSRAARTRGKVTPLRLPEEPYTPKAIRFTADTVEALRDELNRVFAELAERIETEAVVVKNVQFVPVRGPMQKGDAPFGTMYMREYEYDLDNDDEPLDCVHFVVPNSSETKSLGRIPLEAATVDGDGNSTTGGLKDD